MDRIGGAGSKSVFLIAEQLRAKVPGGIGTHTKALLSALSKLKGDFSELDLQIVATRASGTDPLAEFDIAVRYLPLGHELFMRLSDLRVPLLGRRPGIYHSFSIQVPTVSTESQRVVCTVHDVAFVSRPDFFTKHGVRWHNKQLRMIGGDDFPIVAVSEHTKASLTATGIDEKRIRVIESGADHLGEPDTRGCERILRSIGVSKGFILSVSTLEPRKNLSGLIEAFRQARLAHPLIPELLIVGPSGWGPSLTVVPGVHFLGHVPEGILAALYRAASLLVYVPFEEGFGLPVVEAMRCGLPVVSSNVPSAGNAVELVEPRSPESVAAGISTVLNDSKRRQFLIEQGMIRAGQLTWASTARQHLELWSEVE
jgi:glycosyltransferase involved in cell wall biosynthesis